MTFDEQLQLINSGSKFVENQMKNFLNPFMTEAVMT